MRSAPRRKPGTRPPRLESGASGAAGDEPRTNRNNTSRGRTPPTGRAGHAQPEGYVAGYNGQLAVTPGQVTIGAMLSSTISTEPCCTR